MDDPVATSSTTGKLDENGGLMYRRNSAEKRYMIAHLMLRMLAIGSAIASIIVMVTTRQTVLIFGFSTTARYQYSSAYRFLVGVDAVASGFCIMSMVFLCHLYRSKTQHVSSSYYILLHDLVMTVLMASGCGAASAIGYVGRYGEEKSNWSAVCDYINHFCNLILISTLLSYISFFSFFALTILSAHKLILISQPTQSI